MADSPSLVLINEILVAVCHYCDKEKVLYREIKKHSHKWDSWNGFLISHWTAQWTKISLLFKTYTIFYEMGCMLFRFRESDNAKYAVRVQKSLKYSKKVQTCYFKML